MLWGARAAWREDDPWASHLPVAAEPKPVARGAMLIPVLEKEPQAPEFSAVATNFMQICFGCLWLESPGILN